MDAHNSTEVLARFKVSKLDEPMPILKKRALGRSTCCTELLLMRQAPSVNSVEKGCWLLSKSVFRRDGEDVTGLSKSPQEDTFSRNEKKRSLSRDRQFAPLQAPSALQSSHGKNHAVWPNDRTRDRTLGR